MLQADSSNNSSSAASTSSAAPPQQQPMKLDAHQLLTPITSYNTYNSQNSNNSSDKSTNQNFNNSFVGDMRTSAFQLPINSQVDSRNGHSNANQHNINQQGQQKCQQNNIHFSSFHGFQANPPQNSQPQMIYDAQNPAPLTIPAVITQLSQNTGYPIKQHNGQRTFGPHVNDAGISPPRGSEVFVGKIPRDLYEDELVPLFEAVGKIYMMRLMMDFDGRNRGYCFITYLQKSHARLAIAKFNNYEIRKGRFLGVCSSVDNCRLFVGGIPKCKSRDEIKQEIISSTEGVKEVIVYLNPIDSTKNRGFAFIEYRDHRSAAMARRKLAPGKVLIFNTQVAVDWAEPEDETDENIMSKVKIVYVRNIAGKTTEEEIHDIFKDFGELERVKKLRDYAFVHFADRNEALHALTRVNGKRVDGFMWEVTLAKPVTDKMDSSKMAMVGAKALAAAQAGVDPEMLQATQTANYLLQGGNTQHIPDLIHNGNNEEGNGDMDWKYLARIYPTRSGKGRAAMRSCYLGYSAGKATYGRYYTKNQAEKTNQLLCTMQREVFTRLETAVHQLSQQLGFGNFRVIVEQDFNSNGFFGKIFFSGLGDQPSYVSIMYQSYDFARRAILEQTVTGLSGIINSLNNQNQAQGLAVINQRIQPGMHHTEMQHTGMQQATVQQNRMHHVQTAMQSNHFQSSGVQQIQQIGPVYNVTQTGQAIYVNSGAYAPAMVNQNNDSRGNIQELNMNAQSNKEAFTLSNYVQ